MNDALRYDDGKLEFIHIHPLEWQAFLVDACASKEVIALNKAMDEWFYNRTNLPSLSVAALEASAPVFAVGAKKYEAFNYWKGMAFSRVLNSFRRHTFALVGKWEQNDPETGLPHLSHMYCNYIMARTYQSLGVGIDDRPNAPKSAVVTQLQKCGCKRCK
jgi:hypothetical protein